MYLPTHRSATPPHMREDELRFKKLARKASDILDNIDKHDPFNAKFATKCAALQSDEKFWKDRTEAILVCAGADQFETYDLTLETDEYVAVDNHYHLAAIYGLLEDSVPFSVLAVAQDRVLLFSGDNYGLTLTDHEVFSDAAYKRDDKHDNDKYLYEAERHRNFLHVDKKFFASADKKSPLILAGVESDVAEYRSLSKHPRILDQAILGNYGPDSAPELFSASEGIVTEEVIEANHRKRLANYQRLRYDPNLASDDVVNIEDAAEKGRVDTLLIGMSRTTTDSVNDVVEPIRKITFPDELESQVIDHLAELVRSQDGHIITVSQDQLPDSSPLYALYRY